MNVVIRLEEEKDYDRVEEMTRAAFWNLYKPGCDEHYLAHILRGHPDYLADLGYVAEVEGEIAGLIMYTKSHVADEQGEILDTVTFGPLCVAPKFQRRGIGTKLIEFTRDLAVKKGFPAIIILGDPHNYCKHGFKTGKDFNVSMRDGRYPLGLLVLELKKGIFAGRKWRFKESDAFELDPGKIEEYDKRFPAWEKGYAYSQELFSMLVRSVVE